MAESPDLSELLRRTVQANAKFYKGWVDLSLDYLRGITEIFGGDVASTASEPAQEQAADAGVLVLEAEAGSAARGAFLVTNDLGRTMTCELVASPLTDSRGASARAQVTFEPAQFQLAPGEQRVVHATIPVQTELAAGVAYSGEIGIKGMAGFSVPVVVRRSHGVDEQPATAARAESGAQRASAAAGPQKSSRGKPAGARQKPSPGKPAGARQKPSPGKPAGARQKPSTEQPARARAGKQAGAKKAVRKAAAREK